MALFRRETLRSFYHRLPTPPHSNYTFRRIDPFPLMSDNAVVFDIGAKDTALTLPRGIRRVTVDIDPRVAPDIVADAHDLHMIPSASADGVLVISVLHHCRKPWIVVQELHRMLKPGGVIYANIPFMFPFHVDPDDTTGASATTGWTCSSSSSTRSRAAIIGVRPRP